MSVTTTLWEHANFAGFSGTADTGPSRYRWVKYGSAQNDTFSSMRAWANGNRGNVYAFEDTDFRGRFMSLNVGGAFSSSWWSYFGGAFNDVVSSLLVVAREAEDRERDIALAAVVSGQFVSMFDLKTQGKPVSRDGDPRLYGTFFPSWDVNGVFVTIDQGLTVQVRIPLKQRITIWNPFGDDLVIDIDLGTFRWSDYKARVTYDVAFYVDGEGTLHGYARRSWVWVEGGILSQRVLDDLAPQLHSAKPGLTAAIEGALSAFRRSRFRDVYLLPGGRPDLGRFGEAGRFDDDVTLVVVKA